MVAGARTRQSERYVSTARQEILDRIQNANRSEHSGRHQEYEALVRSYSTAGRLDWNRRLDLFVDRLHDYGAIVYRCAEAQLAGTIREAMAKRQKSELLVSSNFPASWLPDELRFASDRELDYGEIDASQGVLTGCAVAIAVTGTIVLRHSTGDGRRALTLIPDYHLCVVLGKQVVETVPEGIRKMAAFQSAPLTTISGPSATSDIEMTRIQGVHGPRTLDVVLLD